MNTYFVVTGAGGFLGSEICRQLLRRKSGSNLSSSFEIKALCFDEKDSLNVPESIQIYYGNILNKPDLEQLFCDEGIYYFIHCAGKISVRKKAEEIYKTNYLGTKNVIKVCQKHNVKRLVYVSSVEALNPYLNHVFNNKSLVSEIDDNFSSKSLDNKSLSGTGNDTFSKLLKQGILSEPDYYQVHSCKSEYSRSKSLATKAVLDASNEGLDSVVCMPSCIIGPGDKNGGFISTMFSGYANMHLRISITGGSDFVDVRDVASGILKACFNGKKGNIYILSGSFSSVTDAFNVMAEHLGRKKISISLPGQLLYLASPFISFIAFLKKKEPILNAYATYLLVSNIHYSNEKAKNELGYEVMSFEKSITDTLDFLEDEAK